MISGSLTGALFANAFVLNARFRDREALTETPSTEGVGTGGMTSPTFAANPAAHMLMGRVVASKRRMEPADSEFEYFLVFRQESRLR